MVLNLKRFLYILGCMAIVMTLIPLLPFDYWWIRMFDFPHVQLTIFTLVALVAFVSNFKIDDYKEYMFTGALIACFIYQGIKVYPYTPVAQLIVQDSTPDITPIKLYTANVLQKNTSYEIVSEEIDSINPDVILLTETDKIWQKHILDKLSPEYQYKLEMPIDNTYGMLLYSKFKFIDPEVNFLVSDSIPSMSTKVELPSQDIIQLFTIHPTPPMPQENPRSTDRDAEMMIMAKMARDSELPVIVMGDFNDVAWSKTTRLFERTGELLDVRKGRGFYCSFDANNFIFRWPLDHLFITEEFRLKTVSLCKDTGSDHFPFYTELTYEPELAHEQKPEPPNKEELESADNQIERLRKKRPIANN